MGDYTLEAAVRDLLKDIDELWAENERATWEMLRVVRTKVAALEFLDG